MVKKLPNPDNPLLPSQAIESNSIKNMICNMEAEEQAPTMISKPRKTH